MALQHERISSLRGMAGVLIMASSRSGMNVIAMHLSTDIDEPLGSSRQNGRLHQMLPWCKARCLELRAPQPERNAPSAGNSASIGAKCSMEKAVSKLQLKWQLAEVAQHAIARQGLPVASMPQEMRLQQRLGGFVGEGKVLL